MKFTRMCWDYTEAYNVKNAKTRIFKTTILWTAAYLYLNRYIKV